MSDFGTHVAGGSLPFVPDFSQLVTWGAADEWIAGCWRGSATRPGGLAAMDGGTAAPLWRINDGVLTPSGLAVSGDGARIVWSYTGGSSPVPDGGHPGAGRVRVIDAGTGDDLWSAAPRALRPRFSPDGALLAFQAGAAVQVHEAASGALRWRQELRQTLPPPPIVFGRNAKLLLVRTDADEVQLFAAMTGVPGATLRDSASVVFEFDDDDRRILAFGADPDPTIRVFDADTGAVHAERTLQVTGGHDFAGPLLPTGPGAGPAAISVGAGLVAVATRAGFGVFDLADGRARFRPVAFDRFADLPRTVAFAPDGRTVCALGPFGSGERIARIFDATTGSVLWEDRTQVIGAVGFGPAGTRFAVAGSAETPGSGFIDVYSTGNSPGEPRWERPLQGRPSLVAAGSDTVAAVYADQQTSRLTTLRVDSGELLRERTIPGVVSALAVSRVSDFCAVGGSDATLRVFGMRDDTEHWRGRHLGPINDIAIGSEADGVIVTASSDKFARLFLRALAPGADPNDNPPRWKSPHPMSVTRIAISADRQWIATGCADRHTRILAADDGDIVHPPFRHDGRVRALAFSRTGSLLATANDDSTVTLIDASTGVSRTLAHPTGVTAVAFGSDPTLIATVTGTPEHTVRIWQVTAASATVTMTLAEPAPINAAEFAPAASTLAVGTDSQTVVMIDAAAAGEIRRMVLRDPVVDIGFDTAGTLLVLAAGTSVHGFNV
ncbi:WD40 repeat domain-containing protein [Nocardia sp. GCM10030253]|uniref:WD40 repeat domain-containing protein n=1 Tax=Nocardia sp. GCM10030253 TaxID=3273404 RepID=UPI0036339F38